MTQEATHETKPVLIYTDDGRDVDDIEAIAYLAGCPNIEIVGLVTTHMIPDRRALIARAVLNNLGKFNVPIGVGSVFPMDKEDELLTAYLRQHTIQGRTYEGEGLIECFADGATLINETIEQYGQDLQIAVLAPLTDLALTARRYPDNFRRIGGLYIQGQATVSNGLLVPDAAAYNISEDKEAAVRVFEFQDDIRMTLVGKYAAYQVSFTRGDFDLFEATGNPVGFYLKKHAENGLACFAERDPETFERVFGVSADQLHALNELSKPYDALVAKAIARPEGLLAECVGHHALIGMTEQNHGVEDAQALRLELLSTIMGALRQAPLAG